jgi:hypothetical protein
MREPTGQSGVPAATLLLVKQGAMPIAITYCMHVS